MRSVDERIRLKHAGQSTPTISPSCAFSSVQFISGAQSCATLCDPMNHSTPGFPVYHQLLELAQTHVHWVSDAIQPSHPLPTPFSFCLQSFPASGSFPMSQLFKSGGQSIGASASASVLPMNIQDRFSLGFTRLTSLQSKGLSRVSCRVFRVLYGPALTSVHDYWKNHSFDYTGLGWVKTLSFH